MRNKGLVTNYGEGAGGYKTEGGGGGGQVKFYPYKKGGRKKFWGSFYVVA